MSQLPLPLPPRAPTFDRANFVVSASNAAALGWVERWPNWPARALLLHGPAGSGKTHLVHLWAARSGAEILSGGDLGDAAVQHWYERGDRPIAIDDADRATEPNLLHLYNACLEVGSSLLLTAGRSAAAWPIGLGDLASRLRALPAVGIAAPDDALLGAVLAKHFADRQLQPPPDLIPYLLLRIERSFAAAAAIVERLDHAALERREPIAAPLARRLLQPASDQTLPPSEAGAT
jgi:chromosomal replication initiation ATPase DnaA